MVESKLYSEDLSNEVFMEIFDYLYVQHIVLAFSRLNSRFSLLCLHYPNYHIDVSDYSLNRKEFDHLLDSIYSRHIRSLTFNKEKRIRRISIEYLFSLCALRFSSISNSTVIKEFIEKLPSSHQLRYLSLQGHFYPEDLQDLCLTISKLPNLHHLKFAFDEKTYSIVVIGQSLLTVKYLSYNCRSYDHFTLLIPFMSNLIGLNLSLDYYGGGYYDYLDFSLNYLLKLEYLRIDNLNTCHHEINYILRFCPQLKGLKINFRSNRRSPITFNAKNWEEYLSPLKFLIKIKINVWNIYNGESMDLTEYTTEFWTKRNLTAVKYIEKDTPRDIDDEEHKTSLLIS
jgi:hypothetical protein